MLKIQLKDMIEKRFWVIHRREMPMLFIKKKNSSLRLCVNYRRLNKIMIKNKYPLPRIDELFNQLARSCTFSKIDLWLGYHQLKMKVENIIKTVFCTRYKHYEFFIISFKISPKIIHMLDLVTYDICDQYLTFEPYFNKIF